MCGGPKHYAFLIEKANGSKVCKIKVRGFTINHASASHLNMENLKRKVFKMVKEGIQDKEYIVRPHIERTKNRDVVTVDSCKEYRVVYTKR